MSVISRMWRKIFPQKQENIERFKADVDITYRSGWTPRTKIFIIGKECCALSAAAIANDCYFDLVNFAKKEYGISNNFIIGFVMGFDGTTRGLEDYESDKEVMAGYNLGVELHKKYFKGTK